MTREPMPLDEARSTPCPRRPDNGPHLPRFPATWVARTHGHDYSCAYCGVGVDENGRVT